MKLTEQYTWQQTAAKSKFEKLQAELAMMSFVLDGSMDDVYQCMQVVAQEAMKKLAQQTEDSWLARKEDLMAKYPDFRFEDRYQIKIYGQPTGKQISLDELVGFDYLHQPIDITDYRKCALAYALLEPPYSIKVKIDAKFGSEEYNAIKSREFTALYQMFLNDFVLLPPHPQESDFVVYEWSDDWSNFFDDGKEWWGTYFYTVFHKKENRVIVLAASATD